MRTLPALLLTAGIIASLTSCAGGPFAQGCGTPVASGDASTVVTATGKFDSTPTVDFPTPVVTKKLERSELLPGKGAPLGDGDVAVFKYTLLNGTTGAVVSQSDYSSLGNIVTIGESETRAVTVGLECAAVGSRVAIVGTAADAGQTSAEATDSYVFVVDILESFPAKASGVGQIPQAGLPAVVTAPNGAPGVTVPKQAPPETLTVAVLQQGDGKKVAADDHIVVKFTALVWEDSSVFDSTWTTGQATIVQLAKSDTVTAGFVEGLVGEKVGSQVLIVVPPADGYGDTGSTGVLPGSTLIYVVDILGLAG